MVKYLKYSWRIWTVNMLASIMCFLAYLDTERSVWIKAIVGALMLALTVTSVAYYFNREEE
jgi:hypothetical protein